jgi:hypothetical protein
MSIGRIQERLLMNVLQNNDTGCWEWTGQLSNSGYGRIKFRDEHGDIRMHGAQEVSYEAFIGPVPQGMLIISACNNRLCINPQHLDVFDPAQHQRA